MPGFWGWILPSDFLYIPVLLLFGVIIPIHFIINTFPLKLKRTEREMTEIQTSIIKFKNDTGDWPSDLEQIIANSPVRRKWKNDYWGTEYRLKQESAEQVLLISAGKDQIFETTDDLKKIIKN